MSNDPRPGRAPGRSTGGSGVVIVDGVTGAPGELVDRLLDALDHVPTAQPQIFASLASIVARAVGGQLLNDVMVEGDRPREISLMGVLPGTSQTVSRNEYLSLIRTRLRRLTADGMLEEFLVSALRNEVDRHVAAITEVSGRARRRLQKREQFVRIADDPGDLARFRALLRELGDAVADSATDDELAARLREYAAMDPPEPSPAEAQEAQHLQAVWERARDSLLADRSIDAWMLLSVIPYVFGDGRTKPEGTTADGLIDVEARSGAIAARLRKDPAEVKSDLERIERETPFSFADPDHREALDLLFIEYEEYARNPPASDPEYMRTFASGLGVTVPEAKRRIAELEEALGRSLDDPVERVLVGLATSWYEFNKDDLPPPGDPRWSQTR